MNAGITPRYIRMGKAEILMSLNRKTIVRMLEKGYLNGERTPGGHWRIDVESIHRYFDGERQAIDIVRSLGYNV